MAGNLGTTATFILIIVIFLAGLSEISSDILSNPNLDNKSIDLVSKLQDEYGTNFNGSTAFDISENNVTVNSTFEGVDAFARQYLEDKSETTQKKSIVDTILNAPSLILKMVGVENETILTLWSTAIYSFLIVIISLQLYKGIRTGEVG